MENNDPKIAPQYNGIYYRFNYKENYWDLYRDFYSGTRMVFNGDCWRIDQCIQKFLEDE